MYSIADLKDYIELTKDKTECPVLGCDTFVDRQRRKFLTERHFHCARHGIFIGPSTFEYSNPEDNLLFVSADERALLAAVKRHKREDRMARERSEDALTWNVFRGLERTDRLREWLGSLLGSAPSSAVVHYWSCESATGETWAPLAGARSEFQEAPRRSSEPDLIIETPEADVWIEAKFGSSNVTSPSNAEKAEKLYSTDMTTWYQAVCKMGFRSLAVDAQRYELLRLWLLGSYAAHQRGRRFLLVNLVREGEAQDLESFGAGAFRQGAERRVTKATWEDIVRMLEVEDATVAAAGGEVGRSDEQIALLVTYMRSRTLGYRSGRLVKAFRV